MGCESHSLTDTIGVKPATVPTVYMEYDTLGRLTYREDNEATGIVETTWTYGNSFANKNVGKLIAESNTQGFSRSYVFDYLGRPKSTTTTIDGGVYTSSVTYDSVGRAKTQTYPNTSFAIENIYNSVGFLERVRTVGGNCEVHWETQGSDEYGNITLAAMADGNIFTNRTFHDNNGRLESIITNLGNLQNLWYDFDKLGNLKERKETLNDVSNTVLHEKFTYDNLNRLNTVEFVGVGTYTAATYDSLGNIVTKHILGHIATPVVCRSTCRTKYLRDGECNVHL